MKLRCLLWVMGLASLQCHAGDKIAEDALVFDTQVVIEVDEKGHVVNASTDDKLPAGLRSEVEKVAAAWRFEPPVASGRPVSGTTYAQIGVCGLPVGDTYQFGFAFRGNGPGRRHNRPPAIPLASAQQSKDFAYTLRYQVRPDGKAGIVSVEYRISPGRFMEARVESEVRKWLAGLELQPEILAGSPVATMIDMPIEVHFGGQFENQRVAQKAMESEVQRIYATMPECLAAGQEGTASRAVAVDSPFKRLPGG